MKMVIPSLYTSNKTPCPLAISPATFLKSLAFLVAFLFALSRVLPYRHLERLFLPITYYLYIHHLSDQGLGHHIPKASAILNLSPVIPHNHITPFKAGLLRRASVNHIADKGPLIRAQVKLLCQFRRNILDIDTQPAAGHLPHLD